MINWIVIHTHRHGVDVWGSTDEAAAWESVASVVLEYVDELDTDERQLEVLDLIAKGDFEKAAEAYSSWNAESFKVCQLNLPGSRDISVWEEAAERAATLRSVDEDEVAEGDEEIEA